MQRDQRGSRRNTIFLGSLAWSCLVLSAGLASWREHDQTAAPMNTLSFHKFQFRSVFSFDNWRGSRQNTIVWGHLSGPVWSLPSIPVFINYGSNKFCHILKMKTQFHGRLLSWFYLVMFGLFWRCLVLSVLSCLSGPACLNLFARSCRVLSHVSVPGCFWSCSAFFNCVWSCLVMFGPVLSFSV